MAGCSDHPGGLYVPARLVPALLLGGWLLGIQIRWTLGAILMVTGAILWILGGSGRAVGGRRSLLAAPRPLARVQSRRAFGQHESGAQPLMGAGGPTAAAPSTPGPDAGALQPP